jgi:hypothetical protein
MKNYKIFAALCVLAAGLAISAGAARAQVGEAVVAAPIITKVISTVAPKGIPKGTSWLKAEVIYAGANSIVVREQANELMIHSFTFAPELKDKMQAALDKGGYQYGDKINILYQPGQTVALRVHGKPSKPL